MLTHKNEKLYFFLCEKKQQEISQGRIKFLSKFNYDHVFYISFMWGLFLI